MESVLYFKIKYVLASILLFFSAFSYSQIDVSSVKNNHEVFGNTFSLVGVLALILGVVTLCLLFRQVLFTILKINLMQAWA